MSSEQPQRDVTEPRFRPDATWICGHSDLGFKCSHGPTANGKCGSYLHPCASKGETKPDSACASCELACHLRNKPEGTQSPWRECEALASAPCVPVRSEWSFRSNLALNLAIATTGVLLCLMAFPQREATFVPGGLSSKHAQILENRVVSERCSLCHPNSHTASTITGTIATQDELCTRCHEGHLPKLHLRSPHDLDRDVLKQLTISALSRRGILVSKNVSQTTFTTSPSDRLEPSVPSQFASLLSSSKTETECASCHLEHHGRMHDLQAITEARCQACHARQFSSFTNGHPQFENYPAAQPRRIAFTHQAHSEKHFAKKNESFECSKCHLDTTQRGGVGSVFRTLSFETACSRCHEESINAAAVDGWTLLQLPSIQPSDAQQPALGLSGWPTSAQFGYEGNIPLVMRALLLADSDIEKTIRRIPESGDIKSIPEFSKVGRDSTIGIAVATRALIHDIAANGQAAWRQRLERVLTNALARELSTRESLVIDELCTGLPPDIFRQMQQTWFGENAKAIVENATPTGNDFAARLVSAQDEDLLLGSPQKENGEELLLGNPTGTPSKPKGQSKLTKLRGAVHVVQGGWYLDHDTLSLRYMPRGHSDRTLAAWSEFATLLTIAHKDSDLDAQPGHPQLSKLVPGGCTQCHTLGASGEYATANLPPWKAISKPATVRSITKFDHTPHLTLPILSDCTYCHQLDNAGLPRKNTEFIATDRRPMLDGSQLPVCEFKSMHLEQCSACHRPNAASTGCTQCHNYHVTEPVTPIGPVGRDR